MAQPDHLEYQRASRARARSAGGGVTRLSHQKPTGGAGRMSLSRSNYRHHDQKATSRKRSNSIRQDSRHRRFFLYELPSLPPKQLCTLLPDPTRTIVAVAAFLGLRCSEILGLEWPDYTGDEIRAIRSIWESVTIELKTRKSNPTNGPICANSAGMSANLNNTLKPRDSAHLKPMRSVRNRAEHTR
jgi:integrase